MRGRKAQLAQTSLQTQIKIGHIYPDHEIGPRSEQSADESPTQRKQSRQMDGEFGKSHDRHVIHIGKRTTTRGTHSRARNADYLDAGTASAQCRDQMSAELISGSFAGDECDPK
jgi:hypothetical protein